MAYKIDESDGSKVYVSEFGNDNRCVHVFKRVSPKQIKCTKCNVGYYDDPNDPFPIDALNEYYNNPKVKEYNKWL